MSQKILKCVYYFIRQYFIQIYVTRIHFLALVVIMDAMLTFILPVEYVNRSLGFIFSARLSEGH